MTRFGRRSNQALLGSKLLSTYRGQPDAWQRHRLQSRPATRSQGRCRSRGHRRRGSCAARWTDPRQGSGLRKARRRSLGRCRQLWAQTRRRGHGGQKRAEPRRNHAATRRSRRLAQPGRYATGGANARCKQLCQRPSATGRKPGSSRRRTRRRFDERPSGDGPSRRHGRCRTLAAQLGSHARKRRLRRKTRRGSGPTGWRRVSRGQHTQVRQTLRTQGARRRSSGLPRQQAQALREARRQSRRRGPDAGVSTQGKARADRAQSLIAGEALGQQADAPKLQRRQQARQQTRRDSRNPRGRRVAAAFGTGIDGALSDLGRPTARRSNPRCLACNRQAARHFSTSRSRRWRQRARSRRGLLCASNRRRRQPRQGQRAARLTERSRRSHRRAQRRRGQQRTNPVGQKRRDDSPRLKLGLRRCSPAAEANSRREQLGQRPQPTGLTPGLLARNNRAISHGSRTRLGMGRSDDFPHRRCPRRRGRHSTLSWRDHRRWHHGRGRTAARRRLGPGRRRSRYPRQIADRGRKRASRGLGLSQRSRDKRRNPRSRQPGRRVGGEGTLRQARQDPRGRPCRLRPDSTRLRPRHGQRRASGSSRGCPVEQSGKLWGSVSRQQAGVDPQRLAGLVPR